MHFTAGNHIEIVRIYVRDYLVAFHLLCNYMLAEAWWQVLGCATEAPRIFSACIMSDTDDCEGWV